MPDESRVRPEITDSAVVRVPEHVVYRSFEAQTVLLNLRSGQYHGLNETGGRILELLAERGGRVSDAAAALAEECGVPTDQIGADVSSFCAELAERGLVDVEAPRVD